MVSIASNVVKPARQEPAISCQVKGCGGVLKGIVFIPINKGTNTRTAKNCSVCGQLYFLDTGVMVKTKSGKHVRWNFKMQMIEYYELKVG